MIQGNFLYVIDPKTLDIMQMIALIPETHEIMYHCVVIVNNRTTHIQMSSPYEGMSTK